MQSLINEDRIHRHVATTIYTQIPLNTKHADGITYTKDMFINMVKCVGGGNKPGDKYDYVQYRIDCGMLGEIGHPNRIDVSLKECSHVITHLDFIEDEENPSVVIFARVLDTLRGRELDSMFTHKTLVLSPRGTGIIEGDKIKEFKLITFDAVEVRDNFPYVEKTSTHFSEL